jgi:hypothetical protein
LSNGDLLVSGTLIRHTPEEGEGLVLVPAGVVNEWLELEITAKANQLLKMQIDFQRHALLPEREPRVVGED